MSIKDCYYPNAESIKKVIKVSSPYSKMVRTCSEFLHNGHVVAIEEH